MKLAALIVFLATLAHGQAASAQRVVPSPVQPAPVRLTSHRDAVVSPSVASKVPIQTTLAASVPATTFSSSPSPVVSSPQTITTLSPIPGPIVSSGCTPTTAVAMASAPLPVTTYYQPAGVSTVTAAVTPTYVAYGSPYVVARPRPYYVGRGLIGQPKLYVGGQPIRNALRFITP